MEPKTLKKSTPGTPETRSLPVFKTEKTYWGTEIYTKENLETYRTETELLITTMEEEIRCLKEIEKKRVEKAKQKTIPKNEEDCYHRVCDTDGGLARVVSGYNYINYW
jgi:hypothetical protein